MRRENLLTAEGTDFQAQLEMYVMTDDDNPAAAMRLHRVMGQARIFIQNYVAGDVSLEIWHGAILEPTENSATQNTILGTNDDNAAWLWREPVPILRDNHAVAVDDWRIDYQFDWPIRGGKGSTVEPGMAHRYVVHSLAGASSALVTYSVTLLLLFSA